MANERGSVIENVAQTIAPGQSVYDRGSKKLGVVEGIDRKTGWIRVERIRSRTRS